LIKPKPGTAASLYREGVLVKLSSLLPATPYQEKCGDRLP